jgi:RNA polymerase sigma-70 factor (ECF subfamily)
MYSAPFTINTLQAPEAGVSNGRPRLEEAASTFLQIRPRLFGIAHRIVGDWTDAEDIVQEAWVRWQVCDRSVVLNSTAFLVTVTTRLAINVATSARARRESSVDLSTLDVTDIGMDPAKDAERSEALEEGLTLLLDQLPPTERAAYILRVAFDYPYLQIANLLDLTEVNARKIVSRATKRIATERPREVKKAKQCHQLMRTFTAAIRGDCAPLEDLLTSEVACYFNSGRWAPPSGPVPA